MVNGTKGPYRTPIMIRRNLDHKDIGIMLMQVSWLMNVPRPRLSIPPRPVYYYFSDSPASILTHWPLLAANL